MTLTLTINGHTRRFKDLSPDAKLTEVLRQMDLKADRVAVEHNGVIAPRALWSELEVVEGDKLEIVHFVGGGIASHPRC